MGLTEATKVSVEHNTSSPGPTPNKRKPKCIAAVPLPSATAGNPTRCENSRSNESI